MVVAGIYDTDGVTLSRAVGGLLLGMANNGVDPYALQQSDLVFKDGVYSLNTPGHSIRLVFYFAQPFENFNEGDTIPYNLFALSSYVTNISIGVSGITYDDGPLYHLITGSISFNGLTPHIVLNTTLISFTLSSIGNYVGSLLSTTDSLRLVMTMVPVTLQTFRDQLYSNGFGFSYDSTLFTSTYLNMREKLYGSTFYMTRLDSTWYWQGFYRGYVQKENFQFYIHGLASNVQVNYTGFYCDPAFADSFGVAIHDTSLTFGHFYSVAGDTLLYGLVP